jgi:hypothetical protein
MTEEVGNRAAASRGPPGVHCPPFSQRGCAIFLRLDRADSGGLLSTTLRPPAGQSIGFKMRAALGNSLDPSTAACGGILLASGRSQRGRVLSQILKWSTSDSNQNSAPG